MPTAAVTGRNNVARKVVIRRDLEMGPVRQDREISARRSDPMPATMRTPARVGIAIWPTTPAKTTRITSIQRPRKIAAQRLRAPALTLSAVCPTDPPTGWPLNRPRSTLPTP